MKKNTPIFEVMMVDDTTARFEVPFCVKHDIEVDEDFEKRGKRDFEIIIKFAAKEAAKETGLHADMVLAVFSKMSMAGNGDAIFMRGFLTCESHLEKICHVARKWCLDNLPTWYLKGLIHNAAKGKEVVVAKEFTQLSLDVDTAPQPKREYRRINFGLELSSPGPLIIRVPHPVS